MTPMQQMLLGVGAKKKTYMEDVFSTYVYTGDDSSYRNINNGIDLAGKGGMVWVRPRNNTIGINVFDTVRGASKRLFAYATSAEGTDTSRLDQFNSNGFRVNGNYSTNGPSSYDYASWSFRKAKGFFDVVTYTGTGSTQNIAHSLGCIPGMIMVKRTDNSAGWAVYHRGVDGTSPENYALGLDNTDARSESANYWNNTAPTATHFTVKTSGSTNTNGATYIAYVFAGGESTAAAATSIDFSGQEGLDIAASSSMNLGTGQFCIEGWVYLDDAPGTGSPAYGRVFQLDGPTVNAEGRNLQITIQPSDKTAYVQNGSNSIISGTTKLQHKWNHIALTRVSNTLTLYVNGVKDGQANTSQEYNPNSGSPRVRLGYCDSTSNNNGVFEGKISNFRITTNEAVYTSAFKVPTEPLTTTSQGVTASNVKLLCCNGSSTTSSTVTPGTITAAGSPATSTDSPFDEPAGFVFGDAEDQNVIKCGSYVGNGSTTGAGPEIYLGWEPQWVLIKWRGGAEGWVLVDSMRGIVSGGNDHYLVPNNTSVDSFSSDVLDLTPTGFKIKDQYDYVNDNGTSYVYVAIRRSDGYVGKPVEAGTDVFAMDAGNSSTTQGFTSGFPVDFALDKKTSATSNWEVTARLIQEKYLLTNSSNAEATFDKFTFDDMTGWNTHDGYNSNWQSWMWKRHAGFDVVTYKGNSTAGHQIKHSLNQIPEMMFIMARDASNQDYPVYHVGLNGGTNPHNYAIWLNGTGAEFSQYYWNQTALTSTHFSLNSSGEVNSNSYNYLALLFSSVDGISKVGYYDGSSSAQTITTGFAPRFVIIKKASHSDPWIVVDTVRGFGSGADNYLQLNSNAAQASTDIGAPTSTGFTVDTDGSVNALNKKYIYYAHA